MYISKYNNSKRYKIIETHNQPNIISQMHLQQHLPCMLHNESATLLAMLNITLKPETLNFKPQTQNSKFKTTMPTPA
jgi:hypothetical protein